MKKAVLILSIFFWFTVMLAGPALSAEWPTKPVTVIVPWAPGGMADVTSRMLVEKFKDKLGQPVAVNNQGGAGGITGMRAILSSKPDGYTFGSGAISAAFAAPFLLDSPPFDLTKVSYVGGYAIQERILWAPLDKPFKTWPEFIEYAKKNPGTISVGSGGSQSALDVFKSVAKKEGLKLKYVMFKNGGEASTALLGGHVDLCETGSGTPAYQAARQGKFIPLINLGADRDRHFPDLKNVVQLGYPFSTSADYGMVVPLGVPEPIRAKLEKALKDTLDEKETQETMANMGLNGRFMTGKEYEQVVKKVVDDTPKLAEYVKDVE